MGFSRPRARDGFSAGSEGSRLLSLFRGRARALTRTRALAAPSPRLEPPTCSQAAHGCSSQGLHWCVSPPAPGGAAASSLRRLHLHCCRSTMRRFPFPGEGGAALRTVKRSRHFPFAGRAGRGGRMRAARASAPAISEDRPRRPVQVDPTITRFDAPLFACGWPRYSRRGPHPPPPPLIPLPSTMPSGDVRPRHGPKSGCSERSHPRQLPRSGSRLGWGSQRGHARAHGFSAGSEGTVSGAHGFSAGSEGTVPLSADAIAPKGGAPAPWIRARAAPRSPDSARSTHSR